MKDREYARDAWGIKPDDRPGRPVKKGFVLAAVLLLGIMMTGCGCKGNCTRGERDYIHFISERFTNMIEAAQQMNNQVQSFTEASLSDETWIENSQDYITSFETECQSVIDREEVPESFVSLHADLIALATQGNEAAKEYSDGITNKDFDKLQEANERLLNLANDMDDYITKMDEKLKEMHEE